MRHRSRVFSFVPFVALSACAAEPAERVGITQHAIVGGATSTTAQDAAVMIVTEGHFGCTGTLIASNLVLTARHCVAADMDESTPCGPVRSDFPASAFTIALGVNAAPESTVARGKKLFVPTSKSLCGFDIALIQLDTDIAKAKIARVRFEKLAIGETTFAVGYGTATPDGPRSATRRQRQTTVEALGPATKTWSAKSGEAIEYDVPAGDVATGESTCFGDSGGPLFDQAGNVVGVTSRGVDGECVDRPSVYASVTAHAKLIQDAAKAAGHSLPSPTQEDEDVSEREGDEGDEGSESEGDGRESSGTTGRSWKSPPSAGCAVAPPPGRATAPATLVVLLIGAAAASFRRRSETK